MIDDRLDQRGAQRIVEALFANQFRYPPPDRKATAITYARLMVGWSKRVAELAVERIVREEEDFPPWAVIERTLREEQRWIDNPSQRGFVC